MREAQFAGIFYPENRDVLEKQVRSFISAEEKKNIKAGISPHAGYEYSGKIAGMVYSLLPEKKNFVILGVNHSGIGNKISFSLDDWKTPLGVLKVNKAFAETIMQKLRKEGLEAGVSEIAHKEEHSIEVQLPFLQVSQNRFEIIPILLHNLSYDECRKTAEILAGLIKDNEILIASSDFTHYGKNYRFMPFPDAKDIYKLDNEIIFQVLKNNSKSFYTIAGKSTVCGVLGVAVLTEIARIKNWKAKLLKYTTSGDITQNWKSVVGYAGIVFE